jgi:hypothetical protein
MGLFDKLFGVTKKNQTPEPPNTKFTASDALMDEDQFWSIIQTAKDNSNGDYEQQQEELANQLRKLTPEQIILFANRFRYFRGQANTWELWGAIYIIHGGCGDDSFNDFREWVIGQGRDFYYNITKDPDSLVEFDTDTMDHIEWEGLGYIPSTVFKEMTGQDMPYPFKENQETTGKEWAEESDDLKNMLPRLAAKFPDHI